MEIIDYLYYLATIIILFLASIELIYKPFKRNTIWQIIIMSFIFCLNIYVIRTGVNVETDLLYMLALAIAFKDINPKKYVYLDVMGRMLLFSVTAIFFLFGKIGDITAITVLDDVRLWYAHHNTLGVQTLIIALELFYICDKKNRFFAYLINAILLYFIYKIPVSRASYISLFIVYLLVIIYNLYKPIFTNKISKFLIRNSFIILAIISLLLVYIYSIGTPIGQQLNNWFSGRLYLGNEYLKMFPIKLFGTPIVSELVLDSGYLYYLIQFGLIPTLIIYYLYNRAFKKLEDNSDYLLIIVVLGILVHSLMEHHLYQLTTNTFLFIMSYGLFYYDDKGQNVKEYSILLLGETALFFMFKLYGCYTSIISDIKININNFILFKQTNTINITTILTNKLSLFNLLIYLFKGSQISSAYLIISFIKCILFVYFSYILILSLTKKKMLSLITCAYLLLTILFIFTNNTKIIDALIFLPLVLYFINIKNLKGLIISIIFELLCGYSQIILIIILILVFITIVQIINKTKYIKIPY